MRKRGEERSVGNLDAFRANPLEGVGDTVVGVSAMAHSSCRVSERRAFTLPTGPSCSELLEQRIGSHFNSVPVPCAHGQDLGGIPVNASSLGLMRCSSN